MAEQNGSFIGSYGVMYSDEAPNLAFLEVDSDQSRRFGQHYALPEIATCSAVILSPDGKQVFFLHDSDRDELVLPSIPWVDRSEYPNELLRKEMEQKTGTPMPEAKKVASNDERVPIDIMTIPLDVDPDTMETTQVGLDLRYAFLAQTVLGNYDDGNVDKVEWIGITDTRIDEVLGRVGRKLGKLRFADVSLW